MSNTSVLVTGGTGFLGGHIVHQLLEGGQRVRAIVRSGRADHFKETVDQYGDRLEVAIINDLVGGDFSQALKDVGAVIHAAAPMPNGITSAEEALKITIEGSLNILRQAEKAGVTNFAYVSSVAAIDIDTIPWTAQSWASVTKEEALKLTEPFAIYRAEKALAERAVWEFAEQHPHVELFTVNPPFFYGPFAPSYRNDKAKISELSTNQFIYDFLSVDGPPPWNSSSVDVRDVAKALVLGLKASPTSKVGRKRLLLSGEWFSAKDAVEYIASVRPELKDRLSKEALKAPPAPKGAVDLSRAKEVLGIEFTDWKDTVLAAVDALVKLESEWKAKGLILKHPGRVF